MYQGENSHVPEEKLKKWPFFDPFRPKWGPGVKLTPKIFSPKDAPGPKISFCEIKKHVPGEKVTCSGRKTDFFALFGLKSGSGGKLTEKFFWPKDAP